MRLGGGFRTPRPKLTGNKGQGIKGSKKGTNMHMPNKSKNAAKDVKMEEDSPDSIFGDEEENGGFFESLGNSGGGVSLINVYCILLHR